MGGCCSKTKKTKEEVTWQEEYGGWVCRDPTMGPRFWFLADSIRVGTLGLTGKQAHVEDAVYRVDVALRAGHLLVTLSPGEGEDHQQLALKATLHMIDQDIELKHTATKKAAGMKEVAVSFPIVELVTSVKELSFFILEVDLDVGEFHMANNEGFTSADYDKFFAWRSDQSDW